MYTKGNIRSFFFILSVFTCSCDKVDNDFSVLDGDGKVKSARLDLCNEHEAMTKKGNNFSLVIPIKCEGEGRIVLERHSGEHLFCKIGYVTLGAKQQFRFKIKENRCDPDLS